VHCQFPQHARFLKQVIQRYLQDPLAGMIFAGEVKDGDEVAIASSSRIRLVRPSTRALISEPQPTGR